jgi:hypothetical protein
MGAALVPEVKSEAALAERLKRANGSSDDAAASEGEIDAGAVTARLVAAHGEPLAAQRARRGAQRNVGAADAAGEARALRLWELYATRGEAALAGEELALDRRYGLEHVALQAIGARYSPGEAFVRVFSEPLALGCLSPRRVLASADAGGLPLGAGFFARRAAAARAREAVEAREWHRVLAVVDLMGNPARDDARHLTFRCAPPPPSPLPPY